jgi:hypothetical protein
MIKKSDLKHNKYKNSIGIINKKIEEEEEKIDHPVI